VPIPNRIKVETIGATFSAFVLLSDAVVYEGQLTEENPLTGYKFDWKKKSSDKIVGFVSYFELINGFKSTLYMTVDEVKNTEKVKTFGSQYGVWKTEFESMALKTTKNLSRNAPYRD
jgi:recombination protein RecT